jgi:hypothetical protein
MPKFLLMDSEGETEETYDSLEKALEAADTKLQDDPNLEFDVAQVVKHVSAEVQVNVEDVG